MSVKKLKSTKFINDPSEIKRDMPLDFLRGYCVLSFLIVHILWQLNKDTSIFNYYMQPFPFLNLVPGTFFFISGSAVSYMAQLDKIDKKSIYKFFFIILCGGILLTIGFFVQFVFTDPLFLIGTGNIILICINRLFKKKYILQIVVISFSIVSMFILKIIFNFEFPEVFNWPLLPWYIFPFLGYITCLIFPNKIDYRNYKYSLKNNFRSLVFFILGLFFMIVIILYDAPATDDVHNISYVFFVLAQTYMLYGLFGLTYPILRYFDLFKILSSYALELWFIHSFILFLFMISFIRFTGVMEFILIVVPFVLFNYLFMKIIDLRIKKLKSKKKNSFIISVFDFL